MIIIGYSGHSYGVIEAALSNSIKINGYNDIRKKETNPFQLQFIDDIGLVKSKEKIFICVGDNSIRKKIFQKYQNTNNFNIKIIYNSSQISQSVRIEKQVFISKGVIVNPNSSIAMGTIINTGSIIEHDCKIGEFSHIAPGVTICGNVQVGDNVLIGAGTVVLPNIRIGSNSVIAAGSTVYQNIPDNSTYIERKTIR
jgi:UDP-N-acetylbacillosamine N-acetyltransferase